MNCLQVLLLHDIMTYNYHYLKGVRIQRFSGLYSVQMRENTDQKKSKYGRFYAVYSVPIKFGFNVVLTLSTRTS